MQISKLPIPADSLIMNYSVNSDYTDSFQTNIYSCQKFNIQDCLKFLFSFWPWWVVILMKLRNFLVIPLGLKNEENAPGVIVLKNMTVGENFSFFKIIELNESEIILYDSDRHLNCWLSFQIIGNNSSVIFNLSTVVRFNNRLGRFYFFCIKPFHKLIVRAMLYKIGKQFNN
jgi:hypothetical protein